MQFDRRHFITGVAAVGLFAPSIARAAEPEVFQSNGIAINGADPLVYFNAGRPDTLFNAHSVDWHGAEWQFDSAENASTFASDPDQFAPVFGGYCSYAASLGYLAATIPEAWTVYQGKLYLNASLRARELWLMDIPGNIAKGLSNWPKILG